jgi:hypothetical protein
MHPQPPASAPDEFALVSGTPPAGSGREGAEAKAVTVTPVGAANLLGGVTLLPPSLFEAGLLPECKPRLPNQWRHSPS